MNQWYKGTFDSRYRFFCNVARSMRTVLNSFGVVFFVFLGVSVGLFAIWLLVDRTPKIVVLVNESRMPVAKSKEESDREGLANMESQIPGTATEQGLLAELRREGFSVDADGHHASAHWAASFCENFFGLDWVTNSAGKVESIHTEWQAGCTP